MYIIHGMTYVVNGDILSISLSEVHRGNSTQESTSLIPSKLGFDMKFGFEKELDERIGYFTAEYVVAKIHGRNATKTAAKLKKCTDEKWSKYTDKSTYGFHYCSDVLNNTITGSYFSNDFKYIAINLHVCHNNSNISCKSDSEIKEFFRENTLEFHHLNTHINYLDTKNMIAQSMEDRVFFGL